MSLKRLGRTAIECLKYALYITFILSLTLYPILFLTHDNPVKPLSDGVASANGVNQPQYPKSLRPALLVPPQKEIIAFIEYLNELNSDYETFQNYIRYCNIILLLFGIRLLIYAFLSSFRRITKHLSMIALSVGGHAPPSVLAWVI